MSTCCWFSKNTCCSTQGELFDLSAIQRQIKDVGARELKNACYHKLTSLFCFWCDPNTAQFLTKPDLSNPAGLLTLYMCPSFCDELYYKCRDDLGEFLGPQRERE